MKSASHGAASAEPDVLDGNAAAGVLRQVFAFDLTTADVVCAGCANACRVGELRLYGLPMGHILRCPRCHAALIRVLALERACWLDMPQVRSLRITIPRN
jgi:Family of unknown function (DUF6510)